MGYLSFRHLLPEIKGSSKSSLWTVTKTFFSDRLANVMRCLSDLDKGVITSSDMGFGAGQGEQDSHEVVF